MLICVGCISVAELKSAWLPAACPAVRSAYTACYLLSVSNLIITVKLFVLVLSSIILRYFTNTLFLHSWEIMQRKPLRELLPITSLVVNVSFVVMKAFLWHVRRHHCNTHFWWWPHFLVGLRHAADGVRTLAILILLYRQLQKPSERKLRNVMLPEFLKYKFSFQYLHEELSWSWLFWGFLVFQDHYPNKLEERRNLSEQRLCF